LRKLFISGKFYAFSDLRPNMFFLVAENKALPGRDQAKADDAAGRPVIIAWFETHSDVADGTHIASRHVDFVCYCMMCVFDSLVIICECRSICLLYPMVRCCFYMFDPGTVVMPVNPGDTSLHTVAASVAELARAAGLYVATCTDTTAISDGIDI
jgi:hypothetical protein